MADPGLTLGLDLGTSGVRAVVLDPAGGIRAAADRAITAADRNDPNAVLAAVLAVLEAAVRGCGGPVSRLCVAGTSGTLLALDAHGGAVGPISLYSDTAAAPAQARAAAVGAGPVAARALEALARPGVVRLAFEPDWILGHLAGHPVPADLNSALKAGADPLAACWSGPVRALGLAAVLPDLAQPGASLAEIVDALNRLGVGPSDLVAILEGLKQAGALKAEMVIL